MISTLKCGKLPQAINAVRRILPLLPVGKASGILSGTMFKGVCVQMCSRVCVYAASRSPLPKPLLVRWAYAHGTKICNFSFLGKNATPSSCIANDVW